MATGYTEIVKERDDVTFEEFAWRCARAFGAFLMQRDDSLDAPPVLVEEPSDGYYVRELAKAKARLDKLKSMSDADAKAEAKNAYDEGVRVAREIEEDRKLVARRYEAMLAKVEAWEPPTKEHEGMKKFMLEQLRDSIRFDCSGTPWKPTKLTGAEWLANELVRAERDVDYHARQLVEEQERRADRNAWRKALVESIGLPQVTPRNTT